MTEDELTAWVTLHSVEGIGAASLARLIARFGSAAAVVRASPEELEAAAIELTGRRRQVCPRPADAWEAVCRLATPEDLVCVTGSFFIAAEMRRQIEARPLGIPSWSGVLKNSGTERKEG